MTSKSRGNIDNFRRSCNNGMLQAGTAVLTASSVWDPTVLTLPSKPWKRVAIAEMGETEYLIRILSPVKEPEHEPGATESNHSQRMKRLDRGFRDVPSVTATPTSS